MNWFPLSEKQTGEGCEEQGRKSFEGHILLTLLSALWSLLLLWVLWVVFSHRQWFLPMILFLLIPSDLCLTLPPPTHGPLAGLKTTPGC